MSKADTEAKYNKIAAAIREHGEVNPQYPSDRDIVYKVLLEKLDGMDGVSTCLKNMMKAKRVDYRDNFIKDDTVITLIEEYNQEAVFQGVTYDKISESYHTEETGHTKKAAESYS